MSVGLNSTPVPVIRRLPRYLARVEHLLETGQEWVSSAELAEALDLTSSTVRQDLSHLDVRGVSKRGYGLVDLRNTLVTALGLDSKSKVVIVGAGNFGRALALHENFARRGFEICGVFDSNSKLNGKKIGSLVIEDMDRLPEAVRTDKVEIGIVAVPAAAAQDVADRLMDAGVRGILNLAYTHINARHDVAVVDARLVALLQELSCAIKMRSGIR